MICFSVRFGSQDITCYDMTSINANNCYKVDRSIDRSKPQLQKQQQQQKHTNAHLNLASTYITHHTNTQTQTTHKHHIKKNITGSNSADSATLITLSLYLPYHTIPYLGIYARTSVSLQREKKKRKEKKSS